MYVSPVPLMVIRADIDALIFVNGHMLGECTGESYASMPIGDSGDYYVSIAPLCGEGGVITRRFHIEDGFPRGRLPSDVSVCVWPGGVLEFVVHTGLSEKDKENEAACQTLCETKYLKYSLSLCVSDELQLYAEKDSQPFCRYMLGFYESGEFVPYNEYLALLLRGRGARLLLFDQNLQLALDIRGNSVLIDDVPILIERLPTLMGHEKRTRYVFRDNTFHPEKSELGFFTREASFPTDKRSLAVAFFEAVREGFESEALSYLSPALKEDLSFPAISDFFGGFSQVRVPFADRSGRLIGLCEDTNSQTRSVRLYRLSFEDGLIANIAEEE